MRYGIRAYVSWNSAPCRRSDRGAMIIEPGESTPRRGGGSSSGDSAEPRGRDWRIALVGCGRISKNHFDAIRRVGGITLTAVCDIVPDRARAAGEQEGVPSYTSYEEMLRNSDADVVSI